MRRRAALLLAAGLAAGGGAAPAQDEGARLYAGRCAVCHQASGRGTPGLFPPLADHVDDIAARPGGRDYLAHVVLYGLTGRIEVEGRTYDGLMPPFASLDDAALAGALNHVLTTLGTPPEGFQPITPDEIAAARATPLTPREVHALRGEVLTGEAPEDGAAGGGDRSSRDPDLVPLDTIRVADVPVIGGVVEDYVRQCQGCHREDGLGAPPAVPRLDDFVGYYARSAEGRAYLVRVPGVANAPLDDARLAAVLNWMLDVYGAGLLPADFVPYTTEEVARLRAERMTTPRAARAAVLDGLAAAGLMPPAAVAEALGRPAD